MLTLHVLSQAFAANPAFASKPALIGDQARAAQQPIVRAGTDMAQATCKVLAMAKTLIVSSKDTAAWAQLTAASKDVSSAIKALVGAIRSRAPGLMECEAATEQLQGAVRDVDAIALEASMGALKPRTDSTIQGYQDQLLDCVQQLADSTDQLATAAKGAPERLGQAIQVRVSPPDPLFHV